MRLIDKDALIKAIDGNPFTTDSVKSYIRVSVAKMPTIEERKTGKWISHKLGNGEESIDKDVCSECGNRFSEIAETGCVWNFCPNCGAKMEGEQP